MQGKLEPSDIAGGNKKMVCLLKTLKMKIYHVTQQFHLQVDTQQN